MFILLNYKTEKRCENMSLSPNGCNYIFLLLNVPFSVKIV